jgi:thiol-disulfide isomerase/thioredoxin
VTAAYEILVDTDARQIYDDYGSGQQFHSQWQFQQAARQGKASAAQRDFYAGSDDVLKLTWDTWSSIGDLAVVEFYAPWCTHCQTFVPGFKRTALLLEGQVKFGAVNCEKQQRLCQQFGIGQYPTIRFFHHGDADDFFGSHTTEALFSWVQMLLVERLVTLTPQNFDELVVAPRTPWLVDFSAGQWCGPCTIAKRRLRQLAHEFLGRINVGIVDCDTYGDFCAMQNVDYYPNLRFFGPTEFSGSEIVYNNERQYPVVTILDVISTIAHVLIPAAPAAAEAGTDAGADSSASADSSEL